MTSASRLIGMAVCLCCAALAAQEPSRPTAAGGGFAERFKQLDRNADGKVSREEGGLLPFFDAADKNKDGLLTTEEVQAYFAARRTAEPAKPPATTAPTTTARAEPSDRHPDFSGRWTLDAATSKAPPQTIAAESAVTYHVSQSEKSIGFQRSKAEHTVAYSLDGTEAITEFQSPTAKKARVSGRWLPDGKTVLLKTVLLPDNDSASSITISEQMTLNADGRTITLRRSIDGGQASGEQTLVYQRADAGLAVEAVSSLTKPALEVCFNARSAEDATKFLAEGLGLEARGEPRGGAPGAGLRMLLFNAGASTIKVRVYQQPPAKLPPDLASRNGFRVLTVPVEKLDEVVARLKRLGFDSGEVQVIDDVRWAMARNADGTVFELVEMIAGAARQLEIGLVVPDLAKAREFFTGAYGAKELPEATSRVLPGEKELRFTTGGTIFKCWSPQGERESDSQKIPDVLGFRYITHNVRDAKEVHDALTAKEIEVASPLASHQGLANLFMARGPGGVLLEFISYGSSVAQQLASGAAGTLQRPDAASGASDAMFKRLDRNSDGKIGANELPNAERFKKLDANGDGSISPAELTAGFAAEFGGGNKPFTPTTPTDPNAPEANVPKDRAFLDFQFTTDFFASRQPADSALAKVTEANALMVHNGMLFCATSYMPPSDGPSRGLANVNPKVLVKKSADGPWEVDLEAGREFMRLSILKSVAFTTDGKGNKLPKPVSVLVCGTGAWRSQPTGVYVFSRNDATDQWTKTLLTANRWNRDKVNHTTDVRTIWDHVDSVTGVHSVFAGSASGRIFRGVYDPSQPGLIAWELKPELDDMVGHFLCAAEASGVQYVGVAYGPTKEDVRQIKERPVKDHGLFRRVDGPNARWEWIPIKEWEDPATPGRSLRTAQLRGMTAVPAADGKGEVLLIAWDTRDAAIERIDPRDNFKLTVELDVRDYMSKQWGRPVGVSSFAYNDMLPITHPDTGEQAHLIGLWLVDPKGESNEIGKSSWYLVRYPDGTYRYQRIWDEQNPLTDAPFGLRGCRSIRPSPFPEEAGRVWYFCGFDQTGAGRGQGATGPAGWIYKGTLPKAKGP